MKYGACEICKHWEAAVAEEFPCEECDGKKHFEHMEYPDRK